jgi:hypothetical protein
MTGISELTETADPAAWQTSRVTRQVFVSIGEMFIDKGEMMENKKERRINKPFIRMAYYH